MKHVQEYLNEKWTDAEVQETVKELRQQYANDVTDKVEGAVAISDGEVKTNQKYLSPIASLISDKFLGETTIRTD